MIDIFCCRILILQPKKSKFFLLPHKSDILLVQFGFVLFISMLDGPKSDVINSVADVQTPIRVLFVAFMMPNETTFLFALGFGKFIHF